MRGVVEGRCRHIGGTSTELWDGWLLPAEIDGDRVTDYVVDFRKVYCVGGPASGFCGSAGCSNKIYLSGRSAELLSGPADAMRWI